MGQHAAEIPKEGPRVSEQPDDFSWVSQVLMPLFVAVAASWGTAYKTVTSKLAQVDKDQAVSDAGRHAELEATRREMTELRTDIRELRQEIRDARNG